MVVVCLPTYNERDTLERMIEALGRVFVDHFLDGRVLVIDDGSPDGTGELADRLAAELPFVSVLHRPRKEGIGPAYLDGFHRALELGAGLVVEMDCDFSHDPADVPRLVAAAEDADLVLGSRYVPGGGTRDWAMPRRAVSRFGSLYARTILGSRIHDLTGGFKCFRRSALEKLLRYPVTSKGYAFQIELTYLATRAGLRVVEIPIVFRDRVAGRSKMSVGIALEAAWRVPALRLGSLRRHT